MQTLRPIRIRLIGTVLTVVGVAFAAAAWACPDTKTAGACGPSSLPAEESAEATLGDPNPDPALEAPVLSGVPGSARFRDGDSRILESPLGWLLAGSGPRGGVRLSADRISRSPVGKPAVATEAPKTSKEPAAKRASSKSRSGGGHVAKPHRMPSLEIL